MITVEPRNASAPCEHEPSTIADAPSCHCKQQSTTGVGVQTCAAAALRPARRRRGCRRGPAYAPFDHSLPRAHYPPPAEVPLDEDGYAASFPCPSSLDGRSMSRCPAASAAVAFFARFGYVVFRGAASPDACADTLDEVWTHLERDCEGARRGDASTWAALSSATYGLALQPALFSPRLLANRCSPPLVAAFAALLGVDARPPRAAAVGEGEGEGGPAGPSAGLLVSHDRYCFYRPTQAPGCDPAWATRANLHLDLHPWTFRTGCGGGVDGGGDSPGARLVAELERLTYDKARDWSRETNWVVDRGGGGGGGGCGGGAPNLQGVLSLADNAAEDGGTLLVPGFAAAFGAWADALGPDPGAHSDVAAAEAEAEAARAAAAAACGGCVGGPPPARGWLVPRARGGGSWKFAPGDPLYGLARRVPLRAGSLLVWDQRTAHGAAPNASARPRAAQFVRAFRAADASPVRLAARAAAVLLGAAEAAEAADAAGARGGQPPAFTELGRHVFGLWALEGREGGGGDGRGGSVGEAAPTAAG